MTISEVCIRRPVFTWVLVSMPVVLGMVSYCFAGGRSVSEGRHARGRSGVGHAAGGEHRGTRDDGHAAARRGGQPVSGIDELRSTVREGATTDRRHVRAGERTATSPPRRSGTRSRRSSTSCPQRDGRRRRRHLRSRRQPDYGRSAFRVAAMCAKSPRSPDTAFRKFCRRSPAWGPCSCRAAARGRSTSIVNTDHLASYDLSIEDVRQAILRQNLEVPGGIVEQGLAGAGAADAGPHRDGRAVQRPDRRQSQRLPDPHPRRRPGRGFDRRAAEPHAGSTARTPSASSSRSSREPTPCRSPTPCRPAWTSCSPACPPTSRSR